EGVASVASRRYLRFPVVVRLVDSQQLGHLGQVHASRFWVRWPVLGLGFFLDQRRRLTGQRAAGHDVLTGQLVGVPDHAIGLVRVGLAQSVTINELRSQAGEWRWCRPATQG